MKLIDEVIGLLSDGREPLQNALIKAQVVAHRLKNEEFYSWVKSELRGYEATEIIPGYRRAHMTMWGSVQNGLQHLKNTQLSTQSVPEEIREKITNRPFYQSVAVIESLSANEDDLKMVIDRVFYRYLTYGFAKGTSVVEAWGLVSKGFFHQVLSEVRSRLLDFLLNLSDYVPDDGDDKEIREMKDLTGSLFKGAVFGDGASINVAVGSANQISGNHTVVLKNNWDHLVTELKAQKVQEADIRALKESIENDKECSSVVEGYGESVKSWLSGMISKAGTVAWDVPVQVGVGVLVTCLNNFFGISS
ncbi:hypothetical protein ACF8GD_01375 [Pseudomonas putida]|uniref:AbiTii domain-containing protein n=1 Tax=Pseudomonas putida TaxID=303 RepID=UPI00370B3042